MATNTEKRTSTSGMDRTGVASSATGELDWTKPGPGTWRLDGSHFEPDCARLAQRAIVRGMAEGMAQGFERMGGPLKGLEAAFVNGNFYYRMVPLLAGDRDLPMPPAPILWLTTRLHPAFRRRNAAAARAIDGRLWNEELDQWQTVHRPYLIESCTRLSGHDPATMDDTALARHLDELIELLEHGTTLHFRLHVSDLGPIGLLLVRSREWGLDKVEVMAALTGSSPATTAPRVALANIARKVDGLGPFTSLDQLRAVSDEVSAQLDTFLGRYGWRLTTGYDLQDLTLYELPELILTAINTPSGETDPSAQETVARAAGDAAAARLRAGLAPEDHPEFDRLVADARALYGLRDENGPITYQWPAGLLRRGLLEAGRRLVASQRIGDERHVFDLEAEELIGLLQGGDSPTPTVLAMRYAERQRWTGQTAPAVLGPEVADPPLWTMPPALAKVMDVVLTVLDLVESDGKAPTLDGIGIGTDTYVGRARVVTDEIDALARMEPGDVLVAPFTVPTYNAVLATAGAIVVENGGLLCHAAVIAREYGIPGLVGVSGATTEITDGAMVRVDPVRGSIREIGAE